MLGVPPLQSCLEYRSLPLALVVPAPTLEVHLLVGQLFRSCPQAAPRRPLFSPPIYSRVSGQAHRLSIHTLCCALTLIQQYLSSSGQQCMEGESEEVEYLVQACLDIARAVNEGDGEERRNMHRRRDRGIERVKVRVLGLLKWRVNLVTFALIAETCLSWLCEQLGEGNGLGATVRSLYEQQAMKMVQCFDFMLTDQAICAEMLVSRVLGLAGIHTQPPLLSVFSEGSQASSLQVTIHNQGDSIGVLYISGNSQPQMQQDNRRAIQAQTTGPSLCRGDMQVINYFKPCPLLVGCCQTGSHETITVIN